MTYEEFVRDSLEKQGAWLADENARMNKAQKLHDQYMRGMSKLKLHPLTQREIGDRRFELRSLEKRINETHGDTSTMRIIYEGLPTKRRQGVRS